MILYLSIVFGGTALISLLNILLGSYNFNHSALWVICAVVLSVIVEIAIQGVVATIVKHLPNKWFSHDRKLFKISKHERKFYEKIKIRSWKDKVWELGALGGFRKNKIADPNSPEYLLQFVVESNKGVTDHVVGMLVSFLVIFILPLKYALRIGLPVALVACLLCILPTMILRYNIPKLMVAYERARRTAALKAEQEESQDKPEKVEEEKTEPAKTEEPETVETEKDAETKTENNQAEEK
ncbi:MAG: hypothetical protein IJA23_06345 [Clostridia bacterium]|nr:hypothetical protein [Clostridia bacterium]